MQSVTPRSTSANVALGGIAVVFGLAITYLQLHPGLVSATANMAANVAGKPQSTAQSAEPKPATPELSPPQTAASATPRPSAPVASPPATAPAAAPKTATTISFVNVRAGKSTSTPIIMNLEAGTVVQLTEDSTATWQGVTYQGKAGYIFKDYLQK